MTKRELMIAGAMLYVGEGTKLRRNKRYPNSFYYAIEFTNSRPDVIALFAKFMREALLIKQDRMRGQLFIYPDHDEDKLKIYWSKVSGIPLTSFQQVIHLRQLNSKYKPNPLGTFKIRYNSKADFLKLQKIIKQVWKQANISIETIIGEVA